MASDADLSIVDDSCLISNPLRDLSPDQLSKQADEFAKLVGRDQPDGFLAAFVKTIAYRLYLSRRPAKFDDLTDSDGLAEPDPALKQLFRKAAQVAQNPLKLTRLDLSDHERAQLENEREVKFWNQPKTLRVTVVTLCFSAIVQGWIQSSGNGANQDWPQEFEIIKNDNWNTDVDNAEWIFAGVNAVPYLAASAFGCWLSDPLQSMILGRRGAIFAAALLCFASLIGSAWAQNWQQLIACRALVGLGMGAKASVTPIYGAETSPSHLRGALVMNWQLFDAFGIFLGFTANLIFLKAPPYMRWRLQYASACIPTACLVTLIWAIPESPRWLLKQRRHRAAFKSLQSLRETDLQAAVELFYANAQLQIEAKMMQPQRLQDPEKTVTQSSTQHVEDVDAYTEINAFQDSSAKTNYFTRIIQLFRNARTRRATVAASIVMIAQQLCGMNVIMFYSSTFFRDLHGTTSEQEANEQAVKALWLSWGVGLANFVFTFPAYFLIDTRGRRFLLFCTYPGMILSMLAACLSCLDNKQVNIEVAVFMFIFVFFYSWGQGPVAFAYSSEVFPLINREAGMSFAVFVNLLGAGILAFFVPLAETTRQSVFAEEYNVGQTRLLGIFVILNVLAIILIFFFVPETAGAAIRKREEDDRLSYMRLEELNYIFSVRTAKHVSYQVREMLPYAGKMIRWRVRSCFNKKYPKPPIPKKMWIWAEMRESEEEIHGQDMSDTTLSSGADQVDQQEEGGQVVQREETHVLK